MAAPRSWVSNSPWLGTAPASTGSHHLLRQTSPQTLLTPWLKLLRSDSLENNPPRAALFLCSPAMLCFYVSHHTWCALWAEVQAAPGQSWLPRLWAAEHILHSPHSDPALLEQGAAWTSLHNRTDLLHLAMVPSLHQNPHFPVEKVSFF